MSLYQDWARQHLQKFGSQRGQWAKALCPFHDDRNPSLSLNCESGAWKCHSCQRTGHLVELARELGLPPVDDTPKKGKLGFVLDEYVYRDEAGEPLFKVTRHEPKEFRQHRWEALAWKPGMRHTNGQATRMVLYRLPDLAKAPDPIYWLEGEKDVDRAWTVGLTATTAAGGCGGNGLRQEEMACLEGRRVRIIPDNDPPGRAYATRVHKMLQNASALAELLAPLPGVPDKGDLSDWLNLGNPPELLEHLEPPPPAPEPSVILVGDRELQEIMAEAMGALAEANRADPRLFVRGGQLVRLRQVGDRPQLDPLTCDALMGELARAAQWRREVRRRKDTVEVPAYPDRSVAQALLHSPGWPLPFLDQVVETPVLTAEGLLLQTPGYHEPSRTYLQPNLQLPALPPRPDLQDLVEARRWLLDELLDGWKWANLASRTHALGAILLPLVRPLIGEHPTPLHLVEASVQGSGKSLFARCVGLITTGRLPTTMTEGRDDEEWRKRITSVLRDAPAIICVDDVRHSLDSASLMAALTSPTWCDRILGSTQNVAYPNRTTWLVTVNNPTVNTDAARRSVSMRIDPRCQRPWLRQPDEFRHPDLLDWVTEHRPRLLWSALVLCQAWLVAGRPRPQGSLGSFERWAQVVGGILQHAEQPDWLANAQELYERSDQDSQEWEAYLEAWWEQFRELPVTTQELYGLCQCGHLANLLRGSSDHGRLTSLGVRLSSQVDRVYGNFTVKVASRKYCGTKQYRLQVEGPSEVPQKAPQNNPNVRNELVDLGDLGDLL